MNARYKNPDNDPRGPWTSGDLSVRTYSKNYDYPIKTPSGKLVNPPVGRCWRIGPEGMDELIRENRIYFGGETPRLKRFLSDVKQGMTPVTIWPHTEVGHNQEARQEVKKFNTDDIFETPKPERLLERILVLSTKTGDIVLDSFLGSGTTVAVAHKMQRRYIGIELGDQAISHCVPRLRAVVDGEQGGISKTVNWHGGSGYRFYELADSIFNDDGHINQTITFEQLSAHLWFYETKTPFNAPQTKTTVLGVHNRTAYALLYNGILHDKRVDGGNVLTSKTLDVIKADLGDAEYDKLVIYGEASRLGTTRTKENNIEFKQTPYDIKAK
jgi:adenine-specific DNA-methyltransferase